MLAKNQMDLQSWINWKKRSAWLSFLGSLAPCINFDQFDSQMVLDNKIL